MTSKSNDGTGSRCPAGSHLQDAAPIPDFNDDGAPKTAFKNFLVTDTAQSAERRNNHHGHLTNLAYAAEHARNEARKNQKRASDAIYARRRRLREKGDEIELIREVEHAQQVNKKLREENNELMSVLASATAKIDEMGDTEKEWLQGVLKKVQTAVKPKTNVTDESNSTNKSYSMKRKSRKIESSTQSTSASIEAVSMLHSSTGRSDTNGPTQIEDATTNLSASRPLNVTNDAITAASIKSNHRHDGIDTPHRTGDYSIEL